MSTGRNAIIQLLEQRGWDKTICPSEAARIIAEPNENWRQRMEDIHSAVDELLDNGLIALSWQGKPVDQRRGAYRIRLRRPTEGNSDEIS